MRKLPLFLLLVALLAGCGLVREPAFRVKPGPASVGRLEVHTEVEWTQVMTEPPLTHWTIHGPRLNHLVLVDGLEEGQELRLPASLAPDLIASAAAVFTTMGRELFFSWSGPGEQIVYRPSSRPSGEPAVTYRAGASGAELAEFVLESVRREGASAVSLDSLRSVTFAGGEGIRAEFRLRDDRGVAKRGLAVARLVEGRLYMIVFLAAEDYYFPTLAPAVERIVESARIVRRPLGRWRCGSPRRAIRRERHHSGSGAASSAGS